MQINTNNLGLLSLALFTPEKTIQSAMISSVATPLGSFAFRPEFGSAHHDIDKITDDTLELLKSQLLRSLEWLIEIGRAVSTAVEVTQIGPNRIRVDLSAVQADGIEISFSVFKVVG